jgi:hypothetical protein
MHEINYFVSKHPVVVNQMVIDNNSVLHTDSYNVQDVSLAIGPKVFLITFKVIDVV